MSGIASTWRMGGEAGTLRPHVLLIVLWVLAMIALPIMRWIWGDMIIPAGVMVGVLFQAAAVYSVLAPAWGIKRTLWIGACIVVMAWIVEAVGTHTGFLFGKYVYSDLLQPQIADVPILIPLAWFMMLPCAWGVAALVTGERRGIAFVMVSALAFTVWDLFLDPQMVGWGFWRWLEPVAPGLGSYFGIPWLNYVGWFVVAAIMTALLRPKALPIRWLVVIYVVTWVLETIGQLAFWALPGPALAGFIGMGGMLLVGWFSHRRRVAVL
ncbi:MAG: carotenoid biosynthesis protein [Burkholderiales bacterium]|nr:carotenoid biosynthesis protein [Anaerolineae bacterium]